MENYKKFNRQCQREIRSSHHSNVGNILKTRLEEKNNKKNYVKIIRLNSIGVQPFKVHGVLNSADKGKAEILNNQFKSFLSSVTDDNPPIPKPKYPHIKKLYICPKRVTKLLQDFKVNSASSADNLPNRILMHSADEI